MVVVVGPSEINSGDDSQVTLRLCKLNKFIIKSIFEIVGLVLC